MKNAIFLMTLSSAVLTGCAYQEVRDQADNDILERGKTVSENINKIVPADKRPLVTKAAVPWIGGKSVELSRDAALPVVVGKTVTMMFPGRVNLRTTAERLTKVTGIPVRLKPDVFMPTTAFIGGTGTTVEHDAPAPGIPKAANGLPLVPPPLPVSTVMVSQVSNTADEMEIHYSGPIAGFLDQVAARWGINWDYTPEYGITFSRLVTKTFVVKANPGDSTFDATLGKSGGGTSSGATGSAGNNSGANFSSNGLVKMNSSFSVWADLSKELDAVKSPVGKYSISQATGSVTVTDTKEVVDIVKKIIDHENGMLTKQVAIRLDMYTVRTSGGSEFGVDWNVVYKKFSEGAVDWAVKVVSPASVNSSSAASMGLSILSPKTSGIGQWSGSEALVKILQSVGKVSRLQSVSAMTLNRQPVPMGVTNQQTYLAQTTPGTSTTGSSTLPGLEPGQVTTGFLANMLPTVLDSNSILLQFSIDLSELKSMGIISTGSGATLQSIQTPEIDGTQFVQRVALRPGSTLVLTGYERNRSGYNTNGISRSPGLFGSFAGEQFKESVVLMLTPSLVDGAI